MKSFKRKFENILKRSLALMLVLCMFLGCLAYAEDDDKKKPEGKGTTQQTPNPDDTKPSGGGDTVVTSDGTAMGRVRVFIQMAKGKAQGDGQTNEIKFTEGEWRILGVYASNFYIPFITDMKGTDSIAKNAADSLKLLGSFDETQADNLGSSIAGLVAGSTKELKFFIRSKEDTGSNEEAKYKYKEVKGVEVNYYNYMHMMMGTFEDILISYNDYKALMANYGGNYWEDEYKKIESFSLSPEFIPDCGGEVTDKDNLIDRLSGDANDTRPALTIMPGNGLSHKPSYKGILGYYQYLAERLGTTPIKTYTRIGDTYYEVTGDSTDKFAITEVSEEEKGSIKIEVSEDVLTYAEAANVLNTEKEPNKTRMGFLGTDSNHICASFYMHPQDIINSDDTTIKTKVSASQKAYLKCLELVNSATGYGASVFNLNRKDQIEEGAKSTEELIGDVIEGGLDEESYQATVFGSKMACDCFGNITMNSQYENIVVIPACMNPYIWQPVDKDGKDIKGSNGGDSDITKGTLGSFLNILNIPCLTLYMGKDKVLFSSASTVSTGKPARSSATFEFTNLLNRLVKEKNTSEGTSKVYLDLRITRETDPKATNEEACNLSEYTDFIVQSALYAAGAYYDDKNTQKTNATEVSLWGLNYDRVQSWNGLLDNKFEVSISGEESVPLERHVDGLRKITLDTNESAVAGSQTIHSSSDSGNFYLDRLCIIHPSSIDSSASYFFSNCVFLDKDAAYYFYAEDEKHKDLPTDNYKLVNIAPFVSPGDSYKKDYPENVDPTEGAKKLSQATTTIEDMISKKEMTDIEAYKSALGDKNSTTMMMLYMTYLYAGYCGGCVEGYKEEQPGDTIGQLGYRLNFDSMGEMGYEESADTTPTSSDNPEDQKDGMLDAIKGWLYYLLNPKEGLTYIRVWFTNKVGTIICSIHNAMLGTHGVGQTLGVTRYRSTTGFITMPDLSEMEWSSTLMDVLYNAIPYLIIAALILFVLMFATATLPFQKCILGFIIFCVVVCLPIPVTNTVVGWTNRTLSNMYGEKFTYWAMIQQESYLEDIDKAAQGDDYKNYLRTIYEKNSDTNPNQGSECVQVKWQAPKKMQSLMYTSADAKTTKNLFQNSLFTKALQNNYSGERFEDNDTAVYLYRSYLDIANASRYIYRGLFGTDGAFTNRTRALKPLDTLLTDDSLTRLSRDVDKPYRDSLNTMLDDTNAYIDKGYMNKSMRSEVSDDPAYQIRHIYAPLTSKIVTDQLTQRGTIPDVVDTEETLGLHQDFFGFSIAMFNIKGKNVSETQESESETNADGSTPESEKQSESESKKDSEEFVAKTKEDWLTTAAKVKKLFATEVREHYSYKDSYSNSHKKKNFVTFTFKMKGFKDKKISARRDCSGYVNAALYAAGILPKSALKGGGEKSTDLDLSKYGFKRINVKSSTKLKKGDILVKLPPTRYASGHIEIYAGSNTVWSAGSDGQTRDKNTSDKAHTDYLWRKTWEKSKDDKKDTKEDEKDPEDDSKPESETPSTEAPSTRTFYSQLLESAKDPEGFAEYCEDEGYDEPDDANGDPDKEGLHPNELEYSGLATYGIYSESVFYYFSWLLYDYGLNPESSEVDHFKELILNDTSNGSIDFFYNNTGEYGNGELKDFMDMRGLFTYVIPYLKRLNDIVVEWDDYYGLKYYKGIATGENLFSQYTADKSQKYWNNLNTARLYNIYTPWVDLMYDCSYAKSEDIKFLGKTFTVEDPLDPNSYPAAEGRPMIFSQSEMSGLGLTKKDLTAVEKLILKCNEGMQGRIFEILNYANFNDVTLNTIAAMECAFQFNKTFSEENFIRKSGNNIIYPQGFELSDFSYDAYLRYVLSESTGESLVGLKDPDTDTDDFYFRVMKKSSLITGLMYLIVDIVSMYLLPWSKIIFIVLTLLAGMFVILVSLFRLDKQHNFLKKFWDAFLFPIIGFTVVTMAMGLVLSLFMGMANNVITQTNTATIRFGDPVTAMAAILVVELVVFYCYTRFISKQFATVKSNGNILVNTLTGVVGGIGVAVSGAFKNITNGNSSKGKVTASESSTSGTSSANERAINRSKLQVEDKDDRSRRRRSRAEERAERHKEDVARRNNNLNQGIETKEEYNKRKEEERQKTEELNRKADQGANHVQGTESNQN